MNVVKNQRLEHVIYVTISLNHLQIKKFVMIVTKNQKIEHVYTVKLNFYHLKTKNFVLNAKKIYFHVKIATLK